MKLREIFRYEVEHRVRSASTWIYAVFLFLIAFAMIHIDADGNSPTHVNAASRLALLAIMAGLVGLLISAAFFGDAALRDHESRMDPLVFTSPIRKIDYLGGRFLGALTINAIILLAVPIGHAVATMMPYLARQAFGPFVFGAFAQTYLLFLLPNLVLTGAVLFAVAALTRHAVSVYVAAIALFVGYVIAVNLPAFDAVMNLLTDPLGVRVLNSVTERWTPVEKNARLLASSGTVLLNRAVWLAIAAAVLAMLHRAFRFAHAGERSAVLRRTPPATLSTSPIIRTTGNNVATRGDFGARTALACKVGAACVITLMLLTTGGLFCGR